MQASRRPQRLHQRSGLARRCDVNFMANFMANAVHLCKGGIIFRISYRKATFVVCACNLVVMLYLMYMFLSPLYLRAASPQLGIAVGPFNHKERSTKEDEERMEASYLLRRALMPIHLIEEVKELQEETESDIKRTKAISAARQRQSIEVSKRLAKIKQTNAHSNQQGLQKWRKKKLESAKRPEVQSQSGDSRWKV